MIPLRLTVKNFMCYREDVPALDLEAIHVACLSGENGHGKTALLDAITWVLWGQARARTQEELVHQGRQDMAVELEFMARGQRYRASRRYSRPTRGRGGASILELHVTTDNGVQPITGNTVRETEARIQDILHLDYDTFVNTAFLLQGRADLFTTSSPSLRKERLAEVLDLSYYQTLEERAKKRSRELQERTSEGDSAIALRRQDMARKQEYEDELAAAEATLRELEPEADASGRRAESLRATVESLKGRRKELDALVGRLEAAQAEMGDLNRQISGHEARIGDYEAALEREPEITERYPQLEQARADLEGLDKASFQAAELDREKAKLQQAIAVQRERLTVEESQLRNTISKDLEPKSKRLPEVEVALRATVQEQCGLDETEGQIKRQRDELQSVVSRQGFLEESAAGLLQGMEETRKKYDMLGEDEAQCPVCQQPLGPEGQEHLRREYETEGKEAKRRYTEHTAELTQLKQRHEELVAQVSSQEAVLNEERRKTQSRISGLERDLEESKGAQTGLERANEELQRIQSSIAKEEFAPEERQRLARLDDQLSSLGYDADAHRNARERVKTLEPFEELKKRLSEALEALPGQREALATARKMLDRRLEALEADEVQRKNLQNELMSLPSLESELAEAQSHHRSLEKQRQEAQVQRGVLSEQLERLAALEREVGELERKRRGLVDEKSISDELAVAFGKNGIQALVIETAIPQLNDDANELLGRLGGMSLKLQLGEGRKDSRTGEATEELQIRIGDEWGNTRSYETFSGGEAFRINFALRIALSKLLARRSGAPLPILFIDEGFGTQDAAGQERLKEAIQSVQNDFQKIIVITHVDEVKESFPTRIEVTKTPSGSTFVVV